MTLHAIIQCGIYFSLSILFLLFLLLSGSQSNVIVRHLQLSQSYNPLPQAITPLTSYIPVTVMLTVLLMLYSTSYIYL